MSIIVLCAALIVINRAFSISLKAVKSAKDNLLADSILNDKMFDIQLKPAFENINVSDVVKSGQREFDYSLEISEPVSKGEKDDDLKELPIKQAALKLSWQDGKNTAAFDVLTYVLEDEKK